MKKHARATTRRHAFTIVATLATFWLLAPTPPAGAQRGKVDPQCGRVEGIVQLYDPAKRELFNPHAIADYAIDRSFSHESGEATRRAWEALAPKISRIGDADAAGLQRHVGAAPPEVLENLAVLVQLHRAIVLLEGTVLKPEVACPSPKPRPPGK